VYSLLAFMTAACVLGSLCYGILNEKFSAGSRQRQQTEGSMQHNHQLRLALLQRFAAEQ